MIHQKILRRHFNEYKIKMLFKGHEERQIQKNIFFVTLQNFCKKNQKNPKNGFLLNSFFAKI